METAGTANKTCIYVQSFILTPVALVITSPAGAVAKYCDEYVCMSVCLSVREDISGITRAIFTKFLYMLPMSIAWSSSDMFTIGRIAYRREGVFSPSEMHYRPGKGNGSAQRGRSDD